MEAANLIALVSSGLAGCIAVWVPWLAFRFALRQEHDRWLREARAQLYVDLLTEAYAEQQWFERQIAHPAVRDRVSFQDLRLPPMERARLGSRANIFSSREVNRAFMRMQREMFWYQPSADDWDEDESRRVREQMEKMMQELQSTIRRELGADAIRLERPPGGDMRTTPG